ncbi:higH-potential iroN-sulfur protein from ectothiorhodospira transfeR(iroN-sulfur proteiN).8A [Caudoviricetes sp.]|nr:higH-potential iroN-sulfur protein from ectothiorhodospira transfeR(iroN-sulfur proteiN).8A [Caudoviricetes sp.]
MAEADFTTCSSCKYFLGIDLGSCRRFPTYQNRHANEWCGEWAAKLVASYEFTPITGVITIEKDSVKAQIINEAFDEVYDQYSKEHGILPIEKPKRGRKPRVAK